MSSVQVFLNLVELRLKNSKLFVIGGGVIDELTVFRKAGAVAGAIPGVLGAVVFEGTAEVRASGCGGGEKSHYRIKGVDGKLWAQDGARGIENSGVRIVFPSHKVTENVGGDHGVGHTPLVKSRCHKDVGCGFCILPDIGDIV